MVPHTTRHLHTPSNGDTFPDSCPELNLTPEVKLQSATCPHMSSTTFYHFQDHMYNTLMFLRRETHFPTLPACSRCGSNSLMFIVDTHVAISQLIWRILQFYFLVHHHVCKWNIMSWELSLGSASTMFISRDSPPISASTASDVFERPFEMMKPLCIF